MKTQNCKIKKALAGLSNDLIRKSIFKWGFEEYRVKQILEWFWKKRVSSFNDMKNLPQTLRDILEDNFVIRKGRIKDKRESSDGSIKYVIQFGKDAFVETVYLPEFGSGRNTLCISTQQGCPIGCLFCATGKMGFFRNLTSDEILEQILIVEDDLKQNIDNIVIMGMGEPLLNYKNLINSIELMNGKMYLNISSRKITLSTVGIADKILKLAENKDIKIRLSVSLHFTDDKMRKKYIPNVRYSVDEIIEACKYYSLKKKKYITFEYILLKGLNDSRVDALKLAEICRGWKARVNLIPYNEVPFLDFKKSKKKDIINFSLLLRKKGVNVTVRKERGKDILAACGQLGYKNIMKKGNRR